MAGLGIKKNDMVVVLSGAYKGKVGRVLAAYPATGKVLVEGVHVVRKALRKSRDNPKGGIISKEAPIYACKVMLQQRYEARRKKRAAAAAPTPGAVEA